jgi:integrase
MARPGRGPRVYASPSLRIRQELFGQALSQLETFVLTTGDEMRDRIIGALDTGCRRGEMLKIQNKHVDWRHRWIRILKEHSKTDVARVIPFEAGSRLEKVLRRRAFLGADAYVVGEATTGGYVASLKSAWGTLRLLASGQEVANGCRIGKHSPRSTFTGTTCDTRRCPASPTMASPFTSCSCSPATPASRRPSAT